MQVFMTDMWQNLEDRGALQETEGDLLIYMLKCKSVSLYSLFLLELDSTL